MTSADLIRALHPLSTDGDVRGWVRNYLAEAPDPELILDPEARAELAQHASRELRVVIATLAPTPQPWHPADALTSGALTEEQEEAVAAWEQAEAERWGL